MSFDIEKIRAEVKRRQEESLAAGVPFVVLDESRGAYVERQPDHSELLLGWCGDYRGTALQRLVRLLRMQFERPVREGNLEKLQKQIARK